MPRVSVDIDLTYQPVADRGTSLREIDAAMKRIAKRITDGIPWPKVTESTVDDDTCVNKPLVRAVRR
jgi:hypothetical protein